MNFTYFRFLGCSLSKKWYIWVLLILYVAVSAAFLLLVPTLLKTAPWDFWGNTTILPQDMLMFIGALFSAVLGIAIFRDYSDDGTELIIVSKPINRTKIIMTKFIMFVCFSIGFAALSIFVDLGTFAFQSAQDNPSLVGSLILSTFISNLIFALVFGFLAILISLFMNKVWTILLNTIIVTLLTIYSTVTLVVAKTPSKVASDTTNYVNTIKYITNGGGTDMGAALSPIDVKNLQLNFNNPEGQITKWQEYTKESTSKEALPLNIVGQFTQMNNMFGLQDYQEQQANNYFDSNRFFRYDFNNDLVSDKNISDLPRFIPRIGEVDYPAPLNITNFDWVNQALGTYMQYETNQTITVLGKSHNSTEGLLRSRMDARQYDFNIARADYGWNGSAKDTIGYTYDELTKETNDKDKDLFCKILQFLETDEATRVFTGHCTDENSDYSRVERTNPEITSITNDHQWVWKDLLVSGIAKLYVTGDGKAENNIKNIVDDINAYRIGTAKNPINNIYDFLHLILVSNRSSLSSYTGGKYGNDETSALLETMVKLKLFWFQEISSKLQTEDPSKFPDLQSAANTPTDIDINAFEMKINCMYGLVRDLI